MTDSEIEAMATVLHALGGLDEEAQERVIRWAAERFSVRLGPEPGRVAVSQDKDSQTEYDPSEVSLSDPDANGTFEHFADLFAAASPITNDDKALVAAYWVQVIEGNDTWQSRLVNAELRHLGHSVSNITDALTSNIRKKPQRVVQVRKKGSSKQATKIYKLTNEGIVYVQGMLSGGQS